ncbi:MAG TPA: gliding motility-associated C-terminal domain-containing protein, partial [Bacteroidia bacterium]|nr:gliding motility-associated C-terminal domain-containing protein [Bacteroidia bacterium]
MTQLRSFLTVIVFMLISTGVYATHNRAGEIWVQYVGTNGSLEYKATIITYTKTSSSAADRPTLDSVYWGDGSPRAVFVRLQKIDLGNDISKNVYEGVHTYSGNGTFLIHFEDPNRNSDVINIPNSVEVPFYVETELIINPFKGINSSPILTYPPIDQGCLNRIFIHNPGAFDPDGDSLSYELTVCRGANGDPIPGYTFPAASVSFSMDPVTGDLTWNAPVQAGEYNVAFKIIEWRFGSEMGYVT